MHLINMEPAAKYKKHILLSSIAVTLLGLYVLILDRIFQLQIATPHQLGQLPLAADSAFCFLLTGIALTLISSAKKVIFRYAEVICLAVTLVTAILALLYKFGIADLINVYFGMAPQTAVCFILISIAFLGIRIYNIIPQFLLSLVILISFIVILGHLFSVPELHQFSYFPSMALYTAIGFCLLSVAASLLTPTVGIISLFTGKKIGNIMGRRIFFQLALSVILIGYLRIMVHRYNWVSSEMATSLTIIIVILIMLLIVWQTSRALNKAEEKARYAEENFRLAVESAPYALVISDREGKIMMVNHETELLYGYKREELVGQPVKLVIPPKMHAGYEMNRERFFENGKVLKIADTEGEEVLALNKNGREFPIELILIPVKTQKGMISLASVVDLTERKSYEKIIKSQVTELQLKNQEMEQFNYIASHDLQEPLRTVSNYINLLQEDYPEQINNEIAGHLQTMESAVNRMSRLIKSLLEFGRLGRNKKLTFTDCNTVVNNVITDLSGLIKSTGASVTIMNELPALYAYETELRQLFQNLINNAIKFRKKGVPPIIKIGSSKYNGFCEFYVSDNGIGIAMKDFEPIFHIFQRLHKDDEFEGHGIGLANCKKIAEMHGGKIWIESEEGKGSTFKFTILKLKR